MNGNNIRLILRREIVDQLRDRRTLFTILVLPMILYPLLGMSLMQTAQFMKKTRSKIWIIGLENLPRANTLVDGSEFVEGLVPQSTRSLLDVEADEPQADFAYDSIQQLAIEMSGGAVGDRGAAAQHAELDQEARFWIQQQLRRRKADVLVVFPSWPTVDGVADSASSTPKVRLFVNSARDKSTLAAADVRRVLVAWRGQLVRSQLRQHAIPERAILPFSIEAVDVVSVSKKKAVVWAKILPFVVMLWALTGAFYPAIDLCAGEKERGTLETLLSSPATRTEIVIGKMTTIFLFSVSNAVLNLFSMMLTGILVIRHLGSAMESNLPIGLPPLISFPYIILGLMPIAALISALALALASFARSSKEGQYYLIPLLMSLLPLMMLSVLPATELELGTSLIPVTGMMLLLRNLIEGNLARVFQYVGPVLAVTIGCCYVAMRWAVYQFNNENVLFRASEQVGVGAWLWQMIRDRNPRPTVRQAICLVVVILILKFFLGLAATAPVTWQDFFKQIAVVQVATILVPTVLLAALLTRGIRASLRLRSARPAALGAAVLVALFGYPFLRFLGQAVLRVYPPSAEIVQFEGSIRSLLDSAPGIVSILLVFALIPAVCEELAFRGFVLNGLSRHKGDWAAILLSSLFFGLTHAVFQQSIMAFLTGLILGVIAIRTASVLPCILYHLTHNGMTVLVTRWQGLSAPDSVFAWAFVRNEVAGGPTSEFQPAVVVGGALLAALLLVWLWRHGRQADSDQPAPVGGLLKSQSSGLASPSSAAE